MSERQKKVLVFLIKDLLVRRGEASWLEAQLNEDVLRDVAFQGDLFGFLEELECQ
jgi:hypothetical protein